METLPRSGLPRAEMIKRIALFRELKGSDGGLPDSKMQGCIRKLYNVIGFQPPHHAGGAVTSPVGAGRDTVAGSGIWGSGALVISSGGRISSVSCS